jgi:uncharacterized protein (DUF1810 family)
MSDPFHLERFVSEQSAVYSQVLAELRGGRKRSHWIWFIFPQMKGLGRSEMAQYFGVGSLDEARAYLAHPVLGPHLIECTQLVNAIEGSTIDEIFGFPDNLKFRSSMTLFAEAANDNSPFVRPLDKFFAGERDTVTLDLLRAQQS